MFLLENQREQESFRSPTSTSFSALNSGLMPKRSENGFGRETDQKHPRVCRKRKSKQVAATLDSAVEPRRSLRLRELSNNRSDRSEGERLRGLSNRRNDISEGEEVAATLDSVVEPQHSSHRRNDRSEGKRLRGLSHRRNDRSEGEPLRKLANRSDRSGGKFNSRSERKLNSIDFDCYLENIWSELSEDKKNSFVYLDSMWFSSFRTKHYKSKVLRWIKNKVIFPKKYVFVPIVLWGHWCLLILCHLGESLESESTTPCMLLLDSLHAADPLRFAPEIRKFVTSIFNNEGRPESKELIGKIQLLVPQVPQQRNDTDCGKFLLYYINLFLKSAPETFSISEGYPYFMKEDWFTPDQLESFWQELQTVNKDSSSTDGSSSDSDGVICLNM